ncbi:aldose epimerase [Coralloluteibacterium thermophilus]|uniref:Aldose epimerase n=1 Tax=Coralloluteibacterium thermophilum TaxID=2707049 RepID=A0ABV9NM06_9GAMM
MQATDPLEPGPLLAIGDGPLALTVAPQAGGRIAQIHHQGAPQLVGPEEASATIAWGCYPMVPWAGRIRHGRFDFDGRSHRLRANLEGHAIHGVGFAMPWRVEAHAAAHVELSLALPEDARWPFGGVARQHIEVAGGRLRLALSVTAGVRAMPAVVGWHPWFRKPARLAFAPAAMYPRDAEGIAILPTVPPTPGPWDDCFLNTRPVELHAPGHRVRLTSDCTHWVVFDERAHATCIEPQTGPPDAPNLAPHRLAPGETLAAWFLMEWLGRQEER